jgi:rare lipoprotein A
LLALSLFTGCGEKKRAKVQIPAAPPPIISDKQTPPEPPSSEEPKEEQRASENKYKDAPILSTQTGLASWYGPPYHNRKAANGEVFDMNALTAAHRTLPLNSIVRVTNLKTEHSAIIRITDRGPFVPDRIIDLSKGAAIVLDVWRPGTAKVRVDVLETPSSLTDGGRWCVLSATTGFACVSRMTTKTKQKDSQPKTQHRKATSSSSASTNVVFVYRGRPRPRLLILTLRFGST